MSTVIEPLGAAPAEALADLIAESEREGLRFVRRLADEWAGGTTRFDGPGEALVVARIDGRIVGVCGVSVDPYQRRPEVGRVRHLYVRAAYRRRGVGRALVASVMEAARSRFTSLRLATRDPAAARLYERLGFRPCPTAQRCTHLLPLR